MFAIAELLLGLGVNLNNALSAWAVDEIRADEDDTEQDINLLFVAAQQASALASIVGVLIGAVIALQWGFSACYQAAAVGTMVTCLAGWALIVETAHRAEVGRETEKRMFRRAWSFFSGNSQMRWYLLFLITVAVSFASPQMHWQKHFSELLQLTVVHLGLISVLINLTSLLGARLARKARGRCREVRAMLAANGLMLTLLLAFAGSIPMLLIFVLYEIGLAITWPLANEFLQERIPSEIRATAQSFAFFSRQIGVATGNWGAGFIAHRTSIPLTWCLSGLVVLIGRGVLIQISRKEVRGLEEEAKG